MQPASSRATVRYRWSANARASGLASSVPLTAIPLTSEEKDVLAALERSATVQELAHRTLLNESEVEHTLSKLSRLGLVERSERSGGVGSAMGTETSSAGTETLLAGTETLLAGTGTSSAGRTEALGEPPSGAATSPLSQPAQSAVSLSTASLSAASLSAASPSADQRQFIEKVFIQSETCSHYELLEIPRDADRKAVRTAYFAASKRFHPDAYFGVELGEVRRQLEVVFRRFTDAYNVLSKKNAREAYDVYLETREKASQLHQALIAEYLEQNTVPPPSSEGETPHAAFDQLDTLKVRRAAARRVARVLRQQTRPRVRGAVSKDPLASREDTKRTRKEVARDLTGSVRQASNLTGGHEKLADLMRRADESEAAGDLVGAVNATRMALACAPNQLEIKSKHDALRAKAKGQLAENQRRQAQYEESIDRWKEAGRSWSRIADALPQDVESRRKAAVACLKAGTDMHRAADLLQEALALAPDDGHLRVLLGRVYLEAKLTLNAKRELMVALSDERVRTEAQQLLQHL